ncbi:hypothetical protein KEM56_005419, partial [Ascosphaera pollenicola]
MASLLLTPHSCDSVSSSSSSSLRSLPPLLTRAFHSSKSNPNSNSNPQAVRDSPRNINPNVLRAKYAVRGELAVRAEKYRVQLAKGDGQNLPFDSVIFANIGNPQQLDQKPLTFFRQVLSIIENPSLLSLRDTDAARKLGYHPDVFDRADLLLRDVGS